MLISAVQHARDGIGKRRDKKIVGNFETPEAGFNESKRITTSGQQMNVITQSNASSRCSSVGSGSYSCILFTRLLTCRRPRA